jgi:hypothetical protein
MNTPISLSDIQNLAAFSLMADTCLTLAVVLGSLLSSSPRRDERVDDIFARILTLWYALVTFDYDCISEDTLPFRYCRKTVHQWAEIEFSEGQKSIGTRKRLRQWRVRNPLLFFRKMNIPCASSVLISSLGICPAMFEASAWENIN